MSSELHTVVFIVSILLGLGELVKFFVNLVVVVFSITLVSLLAFSDLLESQLPVILEFPYLVDLVIKSDQVLVAFKFIHNVTDNVFTRSKSLTNLMQVIARQLR